MIAAAGGPAVAFAAKAATSTPPIVFSIAEDPVRLGLVNSIARPSGKFLTGLHILTGELAAKQLELLRELVPAASRVAVLVNPVDAINAENQLRDIKATARAMGLQIQVFEVPALAARSMQPSQALCVNNGPTRSSLP